MPDEDRTSTRESEVSVSSYTTSTCSTSVVIGLSKQISEEIGCMNPGSLVKFTPSAKLVISSSAVLPYLHGTAKTDLEKVTSTLTVNSAFRTVAQQYLLARWNDLGRCGITAAAAPGRSNHEGGRALDIQNYSSVITAMANKGWAHNVPGDPVHFEHLSSPDIRGRDVLAFQRLWNRNHPTDKISEDGAYGPQTEARLKMAPATGFAVGATCGTRAANDAAEIVMIDGPDKMAPGTTANFAVTINNEGIVDWPASTKIVVAGGNTSDLYDSSSWTSPTELGLLGMDVAANAQGVVQFAIKAPHVTVETPVFTQFELQSAGQTFGTMNIAVTVTPNGDEDTSSEAGDENDDGATVTGGCNAGGGASWFLAIPALLLLRRRRRQ